MRNACAVEDPQPAVQGALVSARNPTPVHLTGGLNTGRRSPRFRAWIAGGGHEREACSARIDRAVCRRDGEDKEVALRTASWLGGRIVLAGLAPLFFLGTAPTLAQPTAAGQEQRANDTAAHLAVAMRPSTPTQPAEPVATSHDGSQASCTSDQRVHVETSADISQRVQRAVKPLGAGVRLRDMSALHLPCGFHIEPRSAMYLVLTDGSEYRLYHENNAFGFAPAFGFSEGPPASEVLDYRKVVPGAASTTSCPARKDHSAPALERCSRFGSEHTFFASYATPHGARIAMFDDRGGLTDKGGEATEVFLVAKVDGRIESMSFLPLPDAPGGTVTLIYSVGHDVFRAYIDTSRG